LSLVNPIYRDYYFFLTVCVLINDERVFGINGISPARTPYIFLI